MGDFPKLLILRYAGFGIASLHARDAQGGWSTTRRPINLDLNSVDIGVVLHGLLQGLETTLIVLPPQNSECPRFSIALDNGTVSLLRTSYGRGDATSPLLDSLRPLDHRRLFNKAD